MDLFDLSKASSPSATDYKDILALYKRLQPIRLRLNNELVGRLSRDVIDDGAKRIGILRGETLVFDSEDEMSVLMDYCIYNVDRKGRNAVEQYLYDCPPDPDSDEMTCLRAMQHATYAVVVVRGVQPGVGCRVQNVITEEERLLVDVGLSQTARPGTVLVARLLDFGDYVTTTGVVLPIGNLANGELDEWRQNFRAIYSDEHFDATPLIRACLERGASSNIRYEETGTHRRLDAPAKLPPPKTSSRERRALAQHRASKAATNRRCRCGSGKMFKNCCGKR